MQAAVDQKYITSLQIVAKHLFIKPLMCLYCLICWVGDYTVCLEVVLWRRATAQLAADTESEFVLLSLGRTDASGDPANIFFFSPSL